MTTSSPVGTHRPPVARRLPPAAWFALAAVAQQVLTRRRPRASGVEVAAAVALAATSAAVGAAGLREFRRVRTAIDPLRPLQASSLVETGPYAVTRNPMYVALAGVLAAHAVAYRSPLSLVPTAAFVGVLDRTQVAAEEAALEERFGAAFDLYAARVPRWL